MSRRKQQKPQHFYDDDEGQPSVMNQPESPTPDIDVTDDLHHMQSHRDVIMDDVSQPEALSIEQNENLPYPRGAEYHVDIEFSDNDSLSDVDSNPREEHRDASDEDCMKDDYKEEFETSGQAVDFSSVSDLRLAPLHHTSRALTQYSESISSLHHSNRALTQYPESVSPLHHSNRALTQYPESVSPLHHSNRALTQYPESISPPEVAMIHSTLYSLQQQQILQLHLIQQLHQHLMQGTLPSALPNFSLMPLPPLPALTSAAAVVTSREPTVTSIFTSATSETFTTMTSSSGGPQPPFRSHLAELETMTNKPVSMEEEKSKSGKLDVLNRSSSSDEAYFKHRCKYCHKIFGSESALQIHIRSHTGERPFKCNICGNRFTTRGNLKVHFSRHKQKYPHIQMNPNPVPEHLDKILPPPLASITNVPELPTRQLQPSAMSVASMISPKKEQRSPSPVHVEQERISVKTPDQNTTAPVPLPSSLPPFGPGYDASSFLNRPSGKYEDPFEQFMEYDKSETSKLQQLVENLEHKMSDPNECVICHRILSCKSALQMHYRTHTGERPFRCRICGRSFTTKGNLKTHMGVHRAKPPIRMMHKCPICHKEFTNSIVLQQHVRMHTPDMAGLDLATKLSAYKEFSPQYLMPPRPYAGSAPPTPLSGLDLSKSSDNMDSSKEERKENSLSEGSALSPEEMEPQAKRPRLDEEAIRYNNNIEPRETSEGIDGDFRSQYRSLHDLEERVQAMSRHFPESQPLDMTSDSKMDNRSRSISPMSNCNSENNGSCGSYQEFRTTSPGASFGALDLSGQGERSTVCTFCNKSFACRSALEIHYRSHTKERPFECQVCHRGFTTRGNMKQHFLTHKIRDMGEEHEEEQKEEKIDIENNNSPVKFLSPPCSGSSHSTPVSSSSSPNSSGNAGGTPSPFVRRPNNKHICQICQKPFSSASALQIHMRTHTGQKPYKCEVCGKAFTTKGNLKVHMGTHMWNNGPSRRGRRIAMDSPIPMPTKESDFMFHRSPELYFPYPAFPTGLSPKFGNEIPVIQGMNGSFPHYSTPVSASDYMKLAAGFAPPHMPHDAILKSYAMNTSDKDMMTPIRGSNNNNNGESEADRSTSDRSASDENQSDQSPPAAGADSVWSWKTTCHLCNKVCVSVAALEMHLQSHIMKHDEVPKSLMKEGRVV